MLMPNIEIEDTVEKAIVIWKETVRKGFFASVALNLSTDAADRIRSLFCHGFISDHGDTGDEPQSSTPLTSSRLLSINDMADCDPLNKSWLYLVAWDPNINIPTSSSSSGGQSQSTRLQPSDRNVRNAVDTSDIGSENSLPTNSATTVTNTFDDTGPDHAEVIGEIEPVRIAPGSDSDDDVEHDSNSLDYFRQLLYRQPASSLDIEDGFTESDNGSHLSFRRPTSIMISHINPRHCQERTRIVVEKRCYKGHSNIQTIKDVNFYGPNSEYMGSDDGHWFMWDKTSREIIQILQGDDQVVNVVEPSPYRPLVAVSGIDSTIQIFSISAQGPSLVHQQRYPKSRYQRQRHDEGLARSRSSIQDTASNDSRDDTNSDDDSQGPDGWDILDQDEEGWDLDFLGYPIGIRSRRHHSLFRQTSTNGGYESLLPYPYQSRSRMGSVNTIVHMNQHLRRQFIRESQLTTGIARIIQYPETMYTSRSDEDSSNDLHASDNDMATDSELSYSSNE